jgi:hypothetical protein
LEELCLTIKAVPVRNFLILNHAGYVIHMVETKMLNLAEKTTVKQLLDKSRWRWKDNIKKYRRKSSTCFRLIKPNKQKDRYKPTEDTCLSRLAGKYISLDNQQK